MKELPELPLQWHWPHRPHLPKYQIPTYSSSSLNVSDHGRGEQQMKEPREREAENCVAQQRKYPKRRAESEARMAAGAAGAVTAPEVGLGAGASTAATFSTKEEAMTTAIMATVKSTSLRPASIVGSEGGLGKGRRIGLGRKEKQMELGMA
ncbi:hypothetical protein BHE74_00053474 [Ensete ventricosum]|nr:hypothetical protein BHE74_00053474 [Ensete ventricosum]RZS25325.1 hypothetical protein BHM03_00058512 [Ensete ventricosum]